MVWYRDICLRRHTSDGLKVLKIKQGRRTTAGEGRAQQGKEDSSKGGRTTAAGRGGPQQGKEDHSRNRRITAGEGGQQ